MMKNLLPLVLIIFQTQILAQPHPAWRHYTLENGLPDNTIYGICEDKSGHLWFATNTGICRFDGYSFRRFPATAAAGEVNNASVFNPQADSLDRVWFCNVANQLFYVEGDSIRAWQWNHLFEKYRGQHGTSTGWSFYENNSILFDLVSLGFVRIFFDGKVEEWFGDTHFGQMAFLENLNRSWQIQSMSSKPGSKQWAFEQENFYKKKLEKPKIVHRPFSKNDTIESIPKQFFWGIKQALEIERDRFIFLSQQEIVETRKGKFQRSTPFFPNGETLNVIGFCQLPDGRLVLPCIEAHSGLYIYKNVDALFARQRDTLLLPNEETSLLHIDQKGGWWVSTLNNGLFYLPNQRFGIWDESNGVPKSAVVHLVAGKQGELFFSTAEHRLFRMTTTDFKISEIPRPTPRQFVKYLFFNVLQDQLTVGGNSIWSLKESSWRENYWIGQDTKKKHNAHNDLIASCDGKFLYGLTSTHIQQLKSGDMHCLREFMGIRFITLTETPDGKIWASNKDGIQEWKIEDSTIVKVPDLPEPLRHRIWKMDWTADGTLVAATASSGVVFWKKDQFFRNISTTKGLTTEAVRCLFLQGDSIVWAGGNAGLNKITGWRAGEKLRVEQITRAHGLPSNQINAIVFADGFLWVATSGGLVRLSDLPRKSAAARPFLSEIFVQNQKLPSEFYSRGDSKSPRELPQFPAEQNNFQFKFYALNYAQNGQIEYRFRLAADAEWQQTSATEALFSALAPGKYRFEVQAQNEDKIWGESAVFEFEIRPPWWATWWFRGLVLSLAAAAIFSFYKWRTGRLKRRFALQKQISELEQTALRAQMNPHFISNCLNSIQKLVLENDNSAAVRYLARFAKLTRSALEFSGRSEVPLDEEIAYLQNFLALEKLRFKEKFDFKIETDAALNLEKTVLPPMLVQPLVENALKHGFEKMQSGGWLEILFLKRENLLRIEVLDNGQGLPKPITNHSGHALDILRRRFDLMQEAGQRYFFEILNRADGQSGVLAVLEVQSKN